MRVIFWQGTVAMALTAAALTACLVGCGGGGSGGTGSGGAGGASASGGSTGSGGAVTGSGGNPTGSGGMGEQDAGSGGTVIDAGSGGSDASVMEAGGSGGAGVHGGTSGLANCPAGGNFAGMTPALAGAMTTISRPNALNGEGPIWVPSLSTFLYTSKIPTDGNTREIWKVNLTDRTEMQIKTGVGNNGMTLDNDDKIVSVDHKISGIVRLDPATGNQLEVVVSMYMGKHFKSPNDVIVRGDGNIYFSDPAYFTNQGPQDKTASTAFYRVSPAPARVVSIVESTGSKDPNGVALSPDDNTLYTVVTADRLVKKWTLATDGSVMGAGATFVPQTGSTPDGMCVDCAGNLYVATQAGLEVYGPNGGTKLTTLGPAAINCSFGGADHKTLFVTNDGGVWFATVNIPGLP
ncbi:MAG: gluconolactonase [Myxococcales bacterium]|jgi:gluconolactonase|nr:gluconolactonase [Myxococcales bacterium]